MRSHSQPQNAEGSSHPTETEEQTARGGVRGDYTRKRKRGGTRGEQGVIVGDLGTSSSRHIENLDGGDSDSKNTA